jgi:hypothetical protein
LGAVAQCVTTRKRRPSKPLWSASLDAKRFQFRKQQIGDCQDDKLNRSCHLSHGLDQGAVDMAKVELQYGTDPEMHELASIL